jgi:hypothetical protein
MAGMMAVLFSIHRTEPLRSERGSCLGDPMSALELSWPADGLIAVVKRDCPTCELTVPVLAQLAQSAAQGGLTVYTQDDPGFPESIAGRVDDTDLSVSHRLGIEIVPTLIRRVAGQEVSRTYGWDRAEWERVSGVQSLGAGLPAMRPGCGAMNLEPGAREDLLIRFGETGLTARSVAFGDDEDEIEAIYERGWSDGLPVVPPTQKRVMRMLAGTTRDPQQVLGLCPPNLAPPSTSATICPLFDAVPNVLASNGMTTEGVMFRPPANSCPASSVVAATSSSSAPRSRLRKP